jgi:hypothetical protein
MTAVMGYMRQIDTYITLKQSIVSTLHYFNNINKFYIIVVHIPVGGIVL